MARRYIVAIIGDARLAPGSAEERFAEELGRALVDAGHRVQCGGLGGVMEAACRGARSSPAWTDGTILGILPGYDPSTANPWVDIALPTGLDHGRNLVVAQADAVVAIGGGAGTLSEMAFAWMFKRLILAWRGGGWSARLADTRLDDRERVPEVPEDRLFGVDDPREAIGLLTAYLPRYATRHTGLAGTRAPGR